jgi:tRNA threonylcarbamoyladenosine biosynthesis protein TsaE
MRVAVTTNDPDDTLGLGEELGKLLRPGDVVALFGDLGAGKTTLTKGIAAGMGVAADVHSPTFTLVHEHPGRVPLYHVDLYRLEREEEVLEIGIEEYVHGDGVTVIEWADRMRSLLPEERLDITMRIAGDSEREMVFETSSQHFRLMILDLRLKGTEC